MAQNILLKQTTVFFTYNPEEKLGSDCSGANKTTNRVLTLNNTSLTQASQPFRVFVEGRLERIGRYTISHKTVGTTITFLNKIFNTDRINVEYYT